MPRSCTTSVRACPTAVQRRPAAGRRDHRQRGTGVARNGTVLARVVIVLLLAGCEGVLREYPSTSDVDAGALAVIDPPPCDEPVAPAGDGHHNAGEDCMMCHHQGGTGPPFSLAGTAYAGPGGGAPVAGATFHFIDANGTDVVVTSQQNGNFYSMDLVVFPVVAFASLCPDVTPMLTPLGAADGSCNTSGCHTSGFRVHVP